MTGKTISDAVSNIGTRHIEEAADFSVAKKPRKPVWVKWAAMAACLCLFVTGLFGISTYDAMSVNEALLDVETMPPEGLSMTIVDAAPDDAEFLIRNDTDFQVTYGKANRIEKFDGENWIEITTESAGIFPSTTVTMQSGEEMYGMCGWVTKRLILEVGTYRYLLVVEVEDPVNGNYPVVLKAEFDIK